MGNISFKVQANPLKKIAVIIPAYDPDNELCVLVSKLVDFGAEHIIVVDDGSKADRRIIFDAIKNFRQCTVLHHAVNQGKGRALKTAFNYFLNNCMGFTGLVTVDADGQHRCEDIIKVAQMLEQNPDSLILGTRNFSGEGIPFRSRFGNRITCRVFSFFSGINVSDTQTGLRGIPCGSLRLMMKTNGEKFEYEMNMLMDSAQKGIDIKEVEIETIYIEKNKSSHFNPLKDSLRIYGVFLKFMVSSFSSFFVDILSFVILTRLFSLILPKYFILIATVGSRVLSSAFNYILNREAVFSFKSNRKETAVKYYLLALVQMFISGLGVSLLYNIFHQGSVLIKMIVDSLLFITSFRVQRDWVFKTSKTKKFSEKNPGVGAEPIKAIPLNEN